MLFSLLAVYAGIAECAFLATAVFCAIHWWSDRDSLRRDTHRRRK